MKAFTKFLENLFKLRNFTEPCPLEADGTSKPSRIETTLEMLYPYFKFLTRTGIYPFPPTLETKIEKLNSTEPQASASCQNKYLYLHVIIMAMFGSNVLFGIVQLIRSLLDENYSTEEKTGTFVWVCFCVPALITILWFRWKKLEFVEFLEQWISLERDIFNSHEVKVSSSNKQNGGCGGTENQRWRYKTMLLFLGFFMMSMLTVTFNQALFPRFPVYIYSILDPTVEIYWFHIVSILFQLFALTVVVIGVTMFEMMAMMFSGSVVECLKIISYQNGDGAVDEENPFPEIPSISTLAISQSGGLVRVTARARFHNSLKYYAKLEALVEKFNTLFAHFLFFLKMINLINFCFMVYVFIRFRNIYPFPALVVFMTVSINSALRWSRLLISLGSTVEQSNLFRQSWVSVFEKLDRSKEVKTDKEKLQFNQSIQFKCGLFYRIGPSTVLTFFSIATTYLIVLLQL